MSVPNQTPYIIYNANGLTTVFPFEFYIINASDIQVTINGTPVTSGYSVSGAGSVGGGDVIFITPPANGSVVMLERVVPTYRLTDYQDNGDLLADTVNKDFDRLWMAIQRSFIYLGLALRRPLFGGPFNAEGYRIEKLADPVNPQDAATKNYIDNFSLVRTLRVPESSIGMLPGVSGRRNLLLAFDSNGNPITVLPESGSAADVLILLAEQDGLRRIGTKVNYGIPVGTSLTEGLTFAFDNAKGWLRVGGADVLPLDDERNFWRGLPDPKNSWWNPALIGDYSVSFNRNGAAYAVYSSTFGHDCVTYGVASLAGGAGSASGDPDNPINPSESQGYCSFAFGKNVIALGAKSAALCEESEALSRAAFAAGYRTQARKGLSTDPGGEASDGIGATALGENTRAAGDGAFAAGKNVQAYGGSIAIGSGINDGNPAVNSHKDSVMLFAKSLIPGIAVVPGGGGLEDPSRVGVHTKYPKEIVDVVLEGGGRAAIRIPGTGTGTILLQGTDNDGNALSIASLEWTSANGGSAVGTLKINMNNGAPSIELSTDGMVALKNVKTLSEISGAPAGTIYKEDNFLKIVV